MAPFKYLNHTADAGILGIGTTPEEAFTEGAKAAFNLMVDIDRVKPKEEVEIECSSDRMDTLFVEWLGELLLQRDITGMVFSEFKVEIEEAGEELKLKGKAYGEPLDPKRHRAKVEVKAATYSGLKFEEVAGEYHVQCVVDL